MNYFLLISLLLLAPVAGAEQSGWTDSKSDEIIFNESTSGVNRIIVGNAVVTRQGDNWKCQDQPAEEAKQSDADKWREKCDWWLEKLNESVTDEEVALYSSTAIAYCTRYNSALLEEIAQK